MNTLVVYDSEFGNTEQIARAVAEALNKFGPARAVRVNNTGANELKGIDLLILGCPTQAWGATPAFRAFFESISNAARQGLPVAVFDTRFSMPGFVTGSAARSMTKQVRRLGLRLLLPPESFFVKGKEGPLYDGEIERAGQWAHLVFEKFPAQQTQPLANAF